MLRVPVALLALLPVLAPAAPTQAATDFWVGLSDGSYVVGQFDTDETGSVGVTRAWIVIDEQMLGLPGCQHKGPSPLLNGAGPDATAPDTICDMFTVAPVEEGMVVIVGHELPAPPDNGGAAGTGPTAGDADGDGNDDTNWDDDNTGNEIRGGGRGGDFYQPFMALLIPDGNGTDMGSLFAITMAELEAELEYLHTTNVGGLPSDYYTCEDDPEGGTDGAQRYVIPLGDCVIVIIVHGPSAIEMIVYCKKLNGCWGIETYPDSWIPPDGPSIAIAFPDDGGVFLPLPGDDPLFPID